jgi:glucose-6-phosphate isomerase
VANVKKDLLLENITKNKSLLTAAIQYHSYKTYRKNITIFFPYISNASWLWQWYKQLVWESLGKDKQGPTVGCAQWVTDQHSQLQLYCDGPDDKLIVFLEWDNFQVDYKIPDIERLSFFELMNIEKYGTRESLNEKNRVHYTIKIDTLDEQNMWELIVLFEVQVAILWELFWVNAFDQPWVERSKIIVQEKIKQERGKSGNKF